MAETKVKIVVVTGCSSGIGLDTAVLLAQERGFKVIATMRNLQKKGNLEKAAGSTLNKTLFIRELDISKEDSITKFLKETYGNEGRVDVLINNAASGQHGHFETVTLQQMQSLFQTNVFGTSIITQGVLRKMKEQKSGHIIFVSSIGGVIPFPFSDFYVATKFAVEGIVGCLAPVLRFHNVHITSIEPGPVQTSFASNISQNDQGGSFTDDDNVDRDVDELSASTRKGFLSGYGPQIQATMQTGRDVAEVIKTCICADKPPVRIQTSDAMVGRAKMVLVDPTGNAITDQLEKIMKEREM